MPILCRPFQLSTTSVNKPLLSDLWVLPVTDEVLLVEDGAVGAEEGVGEEATVHVTQSAHVESLQEPKSDKFTEHGY